MHASGGGLEIAADNQATDNWIFSEFDCNEKLNRIKLII